MNKIILISMPWALFNRPSIQIGTLKAYLESNDPDLLVHASHPYLEVAARIGPDMYHWISQSPWVSEALYAPFVFPGQYAAAEGLAMNYARKADQKIKNSFDYKLLHENLENHLRQWISSLDWSQYKIIGFSVCFHQLFASLTAAREIKKKHPQAIIVFGGSSCSGAGNSLLKAFPFIDGVIEGEGERGLLALCHHVFQPDSRPLPENIWTRGRGGEDDLPHKDFLADNQLPTLADLPVPEYDAYFSEQKKWFPSTPFIPIIPIEFSRGCRWNKCAFCNLNLQWCGFRHKSAAQMMREVAALAARHKCLDFTFVDNMLPEKESRYFFESAAAQHCDLNFFAEIRSAGAVKPTADIFPVYHRGGLSTVQVGIEALSSSLLKKMQKGIRVIENIATMREAQANSLRLEGNLILQFPGSSEAEVAETLAALDYVFPFLPLAIATFFLGLDSPIYRNPQKFGIRAIVNHPNNGKLFPKPFLNEIHHLVMDYRGGRSYQRKLWKPVSQKIKKWQQYHNERKPDALQRPLLSYRDGGDFLLIRQELIDGKVLHHRLQGASRQIYLFCTRIRKEKELFKKFPAIAPRNILSFLDNLQQKRILFSEQNKYLSLAVHFRN